MRTAVAIDGAFFVRRYQQAFPDLPRDAKSIAAAVEGIAAFHVATSLGWAGQARARAAVQSGMEFEELYRIFFYDCPPLTKRVHFPVSGRSHNLDQTEEAILRRELHRQLNRTRKVALRLGRLNESFSAWRAKPDSVKRWIADPAEFSPADDDFEMDIVQKGVDMRLGLDVASMAFKRQIDRLILIAADADFVPAVKLARREGVDVVLDPLGVSAADDLLQHVDGIRNARIERLFDGPF